MSVPRRRSAAAASPPSRQRVLEFWERDGTFRGLGRGAPGRRATAANEFVFYDGPPFANGLPHYGHLLTGFVKDAVPRYQTMRGQRVERRFGWDCHGLPAEVRGREGARASPGARRSRSTASTAFNDACRTSVLRYTQRVGALRHPPGALGRLRQRLQDARPLLHGERHVGVQDALGQGPGLRGLPGAAVLLAVRDAAVATPRRAWTTSTATARTRRSPSWFELDDGAPRSWRGRRRRGRCRRTSPSPSVPTSTTPWSRTTAARYVLAEARARRLRARARRRHPRRHAQGRRARRPPLHAAVPVLRRPAERVPGARRRLRSTEDGTGVVHMAPGFGEDDQNVVQRRRHPDGRARWTSTAGTRPRSPPWAGVHVFDANPRRHPRPQGRAATSSATRRYDHSLPALLALRHAARLPGRVVVVRAGDRVPRPDGRAQPADHAGCPSTSGTAASASGWRNARDWSISRNRFWGSPIPVWKSDDPRYPRIDVYGSLDELERDFGVTVDRPAPARSSTSSCGPTPTTRPASR